MCAYTFPRSSMRTTSGLNLLTINELELGSAFITCKFKTQRQQRHLLIL